MEIVKANNYDDMSSKGCDILVNCIKKKPDAMLCIATGSSPTGVYRKLAERIKSERIDAGKVRIIKLDEWIGLDKDDPATCEYYISENILKPLNISADRYISFNPRELDTDAECRRISGLLAENGGIDCCVLGLGKNGHLGLNEPQDSINPFVHKATLDAKTKTHSMLAGNASEVSEGYTLGIKDILASREILFIVTGDGKSAAFRSFERAKISTGTPASFLWLHSNVTCVVDNNIFSDECPNSQCTHSASYDKLATQ